MKRNNTFLSKTGTTKKTRILILIIPLNICFVNTVFVNIILLPLNIIKIYRYHQINCFTNYLLSKI